MTTVLEQHKREEYLCRMWLLAIAILHWIVFGLLVYTTETAAQLPPATNRSLAALISSVTSVM
jgi:hypothetical protein